MTDRQKAFITRLVEERAATLAEMNLRGDTTGRPAYVLNLVASFATGGTAGPDTRQTSALIDWLLTVERDPRPAPTAAGPDVPEGRYALVADDGVVKFYAVDRPTEGRWAGYVFVNALGSEERYPIRDRNAKAAILAAIAADVDEARIRYGIELGRCGCCGRALTDEVSRAAAVGPDCAARYGIDRSVYAERAAALAAARVKGDVRLDGEDDGMTMSYHAAVAA